MQLKTKINAEDGKQELLIPNPLTDPEGYAKAKGKRPEKND